jgi:tRNA G18 (ribose-2'-O)-methylase SpoU
MDVVAALHADGYKVFSIELCEGSIPLHEFRAQPGERYAVVLGNEVKGVQQAVVDASDGAIEIPQFGTKHSLNVSVTAGMVIWEFAKKLGLVQ